ncbi:Cell wall galactomannoprotein [Akanthomyces lecanii RCEF 1005]|uniref:Cell wall galactomannoprotein n=1 Tax=Akanthomyces lecanii RCEF 1005 TaxID=1081108 RepID=A0A168FN61_CORDF|nr:Cell wall galactomannoprotein [Akanthomyces lecanii RCEF 1005]
MVAFAKFLWLAFTVTATTIRRDADTVQKDITQSIGPQVYDLKAEIDAFPGTGLTGALTIHNNFNVLIATFNTATSNVKSAGSFSNVAGTTILTSLQALVPIGISTLLTIELQVSSWASIPDGKALILTDLQELGNAASNYLDAIISTEPIPLKAAGLSIKTEIKAAFSKAIAAYIAN